MSRSFKTEPARKAAQQRRNARHSKIEWRDNFGEWILCKKTVVDTNHFIEPTGQRGCRKKSVVTKGVLLYI